MFSCRAFVLLGEIVDLPDFVHREVGPEDIRITIAERFHDVVEQVGRFTPDDRIDPIFIGPEALIEFLPKQIVEVFLGDALLDFLRIVDLDVADDGPGDSLGDLVEFFARLEVAGCLGDNRRRHRRQRHGGVRRREVDRLFGFVGFRLGRSRIVQRNFENRRPGLSRLGLGGPTSLLGASGVLGGTVRGFFSTASLFSPTGFLGTTRFLGSPGLFGTTRFLGAAGFLRLTGSLGLARGFSLSGGFGLTGGVSLTSSLLGAALFFDATGFLGTAGLIGLPRGVSLASRFSLSGLFGATGFFVRLPFGSLGFLLFTLGVGSQSRFLVRSTLLFAIVEFGGCRRGTDSKS